MSKSPKTSNSLPRKKRETFDEKLKLLKNLGIPLPEKSIKTFRNAINAKYRKFGDLAKGYAKNPQNYQKITVGAKTLKTLESEHFDRFHPLRKTKTGKTTVIVRNPPGEKMRIKKGRVTYFNKLSGFESKVIPVYGKDLLNVMRRELAKLKPGEYLRIQVGDKRPIYQVITDMAQFEQYFNFDPDPEDGDDFEGIDDAGNWIAPSGESPIAQRVGWKSPESRPSDYLSIVKQTKPLGENNGPKKEGNKGSKR